MGIYGNNQVAELHAIPGDMNGLWSRKDMEELNTNLCLRKDSAKFDFEALNLYCLDVERLPNKHAAINFLNFVTSRHQDGAYQELQAGESNKATEDMGASF